MQERLKREISRKALHMTGITVPIAYFFFGRDLVLLYTSAALLVFLSMEFVRIRTNKFFPLERTAEYIQRKGERNALAATVYFCMAAIASIFFFGQGAVVIGLSVALISDTAAALVGIGVGRHRIMKDKTLEGTVAGVSVAMITAMLLGGGAVVTLALGAVFLLLDLVDLGIDDNLSIPLVMVATVQVLGMLL